MPTSRTRLGVALAAWMVGALACAGAAGCAADVPDDESVEAQEGELGRTPKSAGIKAGSLEEEGVLLLANDRAVDAATLTSRTRVTSSVAKAIVAFRTDAEGKPRWFSNIDEIDAIPRTGKSTFLRLVEDARANGYVEAPGFDAPAYRLTIPDHLGRPPTSADVTVEAGFDGKTPEEVRSIVLSRLTNTVHESNRRFIDKTVLDAHKAFTISVSNLFAPGSPYAAWIGALGAEKITVLGTTSAVMPTYIKVEADGQVGYVTRGASGAYEAIQEPRYPVIMRARVSLQPAGVRVFYPAWSAKVLTGPTTVITEGGR